MRKGESGATLLHGDVSHRNDDEFARVSSTGTKPPVQARPPRPPCRLLVAATRSAVYSAGRGPLFTPLPEDLDSICRVDRRWPTMERE